MAWCPDYADLTDEELGYVGLNESTSDSTIVAKPGHIDFITGAHEWWDRVLLGEDSLLYGVYSDNDWLGRTVVAGAMVEAEAIMQGTPLQDWDKWVIRRSFQEFSEEDLPHVVVTHNSVVHLIRAAIVRSKKAGKPTVKVRDGLRLPIVWQEHYQVVYNAELPWLISVAMQNAFFGNPLAGEEKPWNSDLVVTEGAKTALKWGAVGAVIASLLGG
jgi:hypothetical protein